VSWRFADSSMRFVDSSVLFKVLQEITCITAHTGKLVCWADWQGRVLTAGCMPREATHQGSKLQVGRAGSRSWARRLTTCSSSNKSR
jgi:hypothetical protein